MASRTPKETLKAVRKAIQARRSRKNRVEVVKKNSRDPKKPLIRLCDATGDGGQLELINISTVRYRIDFTMEEKRGTMGEGEA